MHSSAPALGLLALAALASGCVSASYSRIRVQSEPAAAAYDALVAGESDLGDCLEAFGAPLIVDELNLGAVIAWSWTQDRGYRLGVSLPVSDNFTASLNYKDVAMKLNGIVCFYDSDWTLVEKRRGNLLDLLPLEKKRPQFVEDDGPNDGQGESGEDQ